MVFHMNRKTLINIVREEVRNIIKEQDLNEKDTAAQNMKMQKRILNPKKVKIKKELKKQSKYLQEKYGDRWQSIMKAIVSKQSLGEEDMSSVEIEKRDRIADELMKNKQEFKDRYGDNWEQVLYATATKMAMGRE